MAKDQPKKIIVKKVVKKAGGAHHGGSWKVAYADFVTAMMAFFMVMWIMGMDESVRSEVEGYFADPVGFRKGYSSGASPIASGSSPARVSTSPIKMFAQNFQRDRFREIGERIEARIEAQDGLGAIAAQIEIVMTEEGLRIELIEGQDGETFFDFGSARLKPAAERALRVIGAELGEARAALVLEGHTDSAPFGRPGYSNWELSADRANAARRALRAAGVEPHNIVEIRGHADKKLRNPNDPLDPANRRITILLPFSNTPQTVEIPAGEATGAV